MIFPMIVPFFDTKRQVVYRDSPEMAYQKKRENDLLKEKIGLKENVLIF